MLMNSICLGIWSIWPRLAAEMVVQMEECLVGLLAYLMDATKAEMMVSRLVILLASANADLTETSKTAMTDASKAEMMVSRLVILLAAPNNNSHTHTSSLD